MNRIISLASMVSSLLKENKMPEYTREQVDQRINLFAGAVAAKIDAHYKEMGFTFGRVIISIDWGSKNAKIVMNDMSFKSDGSEVPGQRHVYGFVDRKTGDIYKAASWKARADHARGNIFAEDIGMSACTPQGIVYLRG